MSEAACKTILCSGGAKASVLSYLIVREADTTPALKLAANRATWEIEMAVQVTQLLMAQPKYAPKFTRAAAYELIEAMDILEYQLLPGMETADAIAMMNEQSNALHAGILELHLAVTGESADYQIH